MITDGDLRRCFENNTELLNLRAKEIMTQSPKKIDSQSLIYDAFKMDAASYDAVLKDVNKEAYRSELQKESGIYCREKFGEHGIDITPDILFKNRRRAVRFARRYGNRHRKSNTKSAKIV